MYLKFLLFPFTILTFFCFGCTDATQVKAGGTGEVAGDEMIEEETAVNEKLGEEARDEIESTDKNEQSVKGSFQKNQAEEESIILNYSHTAWFKGGLN